MTMKAALAHDGPARRERRAGTLLEIDLFRSAEPQHVLTALGHSLDVDQVLHPNVLGDGVAAPGAAAQGQRRLHAEVVQVTDAAVRGRGVDDDTQVFIRAAKASIFLFRSRRSRTERRCGRDRRTATADPLCPPPPRSPWRGTWPARGTAFRARTPPRCPRYSTSAIRILAVAGTSTPASLAIVWAAMPAIRVESAVLENCATQPRFRRA